MFAKLIYWLFGIKICNHYWDIHEMISCYDVDGHERNPHQRPARIKYLLRCKHCGMMDIKTVEGD
jgi:hypothetical protein